MDKAILLVEDNPDDEALTLRALKKNNVRNEVVIAHDGAEALDYLYRRGKFATRGDANPVVVLLDLKMPKVDGMQFYQKLAAAYPDSARRVIFVTGDVAGTEAENFLQDSGCRWLAKPFRLGDLLRTAREILA